MYACEWAGSHQRESMIDAVLYARDKYLKPTGTLWPSHCTLMLAAISDESIREYSMAEYYDAQQSFEQFANDMLQLYDIDVSYLDNLYDWQNKREFIYTTFWQSLSSESIVGDEMNLIRWDLNTVTQTEIANVVNVSFAMTVPFLYRDKDDHLVRQIPKTGLMVSGEGWEKMGGG
jgi:type I protein arginine methyltransferase